MTPRTVMQFCTRSKILNTASGRALGIEFRFGPIHVYVIANMPETNGREEGPLAYVKVDLRQADADWKLEQHSTESKRR